MSKNLRNVVGRPGKLLALLGCLLLTPPSGLHAAPIHPPLQALRSGNYQLISAQVERVDVAAGTVWVGAVERLRGDVEGDRTLLMQPHDAAELKPRERLLFVYTDVQRDSSEPRKFVRVDRNVVVHTDGAEPAVFPDTPTYRHLLAEDHRAEEQAEGYRDQVIAGLSADDPKAVDLWLAELVHRPATFATLAAEEIARIEAITRDPDQRPTARARGLLIAMERSPAWGAEWYVDAAFGLLDSNAPADLASKPRLDQAVYAALTVLGVHALPAHQQVLTKWLGATDALAELAAVALARIGPEVEREALRHALADTATPAETQRMLNRRMARYSN
jgi:hypothetical protein